MYKNILIATDGSEMGSHAVDHGLELAKALKAPVTIVTVTERWSALDMANEVRQGNPYPTQQYEAMEADLAKHILDNAAAKAKAAGVPCALVHVRDMTAAEGVIETAEKKHSDLIVIGSHGRRGLERLLLGSQAYEVISRCKVPALIVR
jgi:nucleotide-binding universal stress UspA family protein